MILFFIKVFFWYSFWWVGWDVDVLGFGWCCVFCVLVVVCGWCLFFFFYLIGGFYIVDVIIMMGDDWGLGICCCKWFNMMWLCLVIMLGMVLRCLGFLKVCVFLILVCGMWDGFLDFWDGCVSIGICFDIVVLLCFLGWCRWFFVIVIYDIGMLCWCCCIEMGVFYFV